MAEDDRYIAPQELYRQLSTDAAPFIIDVRGPDAYAAGHLPGAHHIPGDELEARMAEVPRDRFIVPY